MCVTGDHKSPGHNLGGIHYNIYQQPADSKLLNTASDNRRGLETNRERENVMKSVKCLSCRCAQSIKANRSGGEMTVWC